MEENKQITEEELSKVSGGGMGTIPSEGITYSSYGDVQPGYYYSNSAKTEYAYVFELSGICAVYSKESLSTRQNNWYFMPVSRNNFSDTFSEFPNKYPYRLNIRP